MFVFAFLFTFGLLSLLTAMVIARRSGKAAAMPRKGPASLKMDVLNTTNYNFANLDAKALESMSAPELRGLMGEYRRRGQIPSYRDYYLLRQALREKGIDQNAPDPLG